jgi:hypothetical protein
VISKVEAVPLTLEPLPSLVEELPNGNFFRILRKERELNLSSKLFIAQTRSPRRPRDKRPFWIRWFGSARRGSCSKFNPPLIALIPQLEEETKSFINTTSSFETDIKENGQVLTANAQPNFWIYIPTTSKGEINPAEFMMQYADDTDALERPVSFSLPDSGGIVSFKIPEDTKSPNGDELFKLNQEYHWYFSIICNSRRPSRNLSIDGWVKRVSLNPLHATQLQALPERKRIEFYASENLWYETLTSTAELLCKQQNTKEQDTKLDNYWSNVLLQEINQLSEEQKKPVCIDGKPKQLEPIT